MSYQFEFEPDAIADLEKLSSTVRDRLLRKINWLATNFEETSPLGLKANLAGFYKLHVGDYRIIYDIEVENQRIVIIRIGHRSEIYNR
jgi:mRNA interferase RelE/StbE